MTQEFHPEIQHHLPHAVCILVGCKSDLRTNPDVISRMQERNCEYVTEEQALAVQRKINAVRYIETSALTGHNVAECFNSAILDVLHGSNVKSFKNKRNKVCTML